ncbi:hypothetical protein PVK06_024402 [Gossypium arboreum]|uniref:Uncharacterized protein n=1 Tax=Gossypium arboreum TaxID=29729 RepID=A0ABR0PDU4_GOSAR|nr:hypothetical protein PVK06_024402 [Gossypium arboreum]
MALFSGDPSTIMKMAVLLFVLARCGSSITIWKMANLGFFGVFIVPKLCTSYSHQLSAYGIYLNLQTFENPPTGLHHLLLKTSQVFLRQYAIQTRLQMAMEVRDSLEIAHTMEDFSKLYVGIAIHWLHLSRTSPLLYIVSSSFLIFFL